MLSMTDTRWCCWPSSSTCWFYAQRAGLLHCKSPISLLISSFPLKPTVKSEVRFKINMEALGATLVWTICSGTGFHLKLTHLRVINLNYIDDGLRAKRGFSIRREAIRGNSGNSQKQMKGLSWVQCLGPHPPSLLPSHPPPFPCSISPPPLTLPRHRTAELSAVGLFSR